MPELTASEWLAYGIGTLGVLIEWRAYFLHSGQLFRRWSAIGALLWASQYFLLDAWTAGLTMASTALRTLMSAKFTEGHYKHWAAASFVLLFSGLTVSSWQGLVSLLPAFAVINTTLALFYLDNRYMRITLLASSAAWIANDFYWQAWPALVAESIVVLINLHTIGKLADH
ncbi:MAG: YgjV family protein [Methylococcales bacterium]